MPSQMVLDEKKKIVATMSEEFKQAQAIVFTDYRGLTVGQDTAMRAALRKAGVSYQVAKNTLSSRALKDAGFEGLDDLLKGPTAIAYSKLDVISPAKVIKEYADKYDKLKIKGGALDNKAITAEDVNRLARIPGKDVLYGQLVFGLIAPIASLAVLLNAIREKMEAGSAETVAAPETDSAEPVAAPVES